MRGVDWRGCDVQMNSSSLRGLEEEGDDDDDDDDMLSFFLLLECKTD